MLQELYGFGGSARCRPPRPKTCRSYSASTTTAPDRLCSYRLAILYRRPAVFESKIFTFTITPKPLKCIDFTIRFPLPPSPRSICNQLYDRKSHFDRPHRRTVISGKRFVYSIHSIGEFSVFFLHRLFFKTGEKMTVFVKFRFGFNPAINNREIYTEYIGDAV